MLDDQNEHIILSESEIYEPEQNFLFPEELADWSLKYIKHNALDDLLKLLQKYGHENLPSSARTLLKTYRHVEITEKFGMHYVYLGLKKNLINNLSKYVTTKTNANMLSLLLNVDG